MKCEACGGDGLVEVGAYRGDESDPNTRECRLCGGVVALEPRRLAQQVVDEPWETTTFKDEHGQMRTLREVGSAGHAAQQLQQLAHAASESGVRLSRPWEPEKVSDVKFVPRVMTAKEVADNYAQRLNEQNEREQRKVVFHVHAWKRGADTPRGYARFDCVDCPAWLSLTPKGQLSEYSHLDKELPAKELDILAAQIAQPNAEVNQYLRQLLKE